MTSSKVSIRPATSGDLAAIERVDTAAFPEHDRFKRGALRKLLRSTTEIAVVGEHNGVVAGFTQVRSHDGECWLRAIGVHPSCRRRGLGKQMAEWAVRHARRRGEPLKLAVRASNVAAQRLYDCVGFRACEVRERYYPDGEAALIFEIR